MFHRSDTGASQKICTCINLAHSRTRK